MENIFLTLLNRSITAGWLILAVIVLRALLRKSPKWMICLLWGCVAFRLICPFSLESIFSLIPSRETLPPETIISASPRIDSGMSMVDNAVNPVLRESFTPGPGDSVNPLQIWLAAAGFVWAVGAALMLVSAIGSYVRLYVRIRTAVRIRELLYISEFVDTPFVFGLIRPRIYLPSGMSEEMHASVIAHEQAHLERRDYLWKVLGYTLLAVYWFHPFCWAAYSLFCKDLELACDEKVIRNYDAKQRRMYSEALLACSQGCRRTAVWPLTFGEVGVKERILSVLHYKKPAFRAVMAAIAVCAVTAVCLLTDPVKQEGDSGEAASADTGNGREERNGAGDAGTGEASEPDPTLSENLTEEWSRAFVSRDGERIAAMAAEEVTADFEARDLLAGQSGQRSFGMSGPWPQDETADVLIYSVTAEQAEIYYYAWTSEPHVTVWKEEIAFGLRDGKYVVIAESLQWFDNISSGQVFAQLYGNPLQISGTRMDYISGGTWDLLSKNALLSSTTAYKDLFEPESAAVRLLNLSRDTSKVTVERLPEEEENEVGLNITFSEDDMSVQISMVQPAGGGGIWIPQDFGGGPLRRFVRMDWDEVKRQAGSMEDEPDWKKIVCIGEIPEKDITVYGYNDEDYMGQGVAIEIAGDVNYFDWYYTTPRALLPEFYWDEGERQLQAALNIYTGTGADAQELHVLQAHDTGTLLDYAFELNDYSALLQERIAFTYDEGTGLLTMTDTASGRELAAVKTEEKVTELELGMISHFRLGDEIILHIDTGYFTEGSVIAEYETMPSLEAEILQQWENEKFRFGLGEIRVADAEE